MNFSQQHLRNGMNHTMKKVLFLGFCLIITSICSAQGKPNWGITELQQIVDLEESTLLIPLLDEPESSSISMTRDPKLMRIREVNQARIAAGQNNFKMASSLFYYMVDSTAIYEGKFHGVVFDSDGQPSDLTKPRSDLFVVEYLSPNWMGRREVVVYNQRRIRKQERKGKKHQDIIDELERQILLESDSARIAKKRKKRDWHQTKAMDIMAPKSIFPKHDKLNSYWTEKEYFHAESVGHRRLAIRRLESKNFVASKNVSYKVNWNFVARLHSSVDEKTKYAEAFGYLNTKLLSRKTKLAKGLRIEQN